MDLLEEFQRVLAAIDAVGPETREAFDARQTVRTDGGPVVVLRREDLIAMKVWAGRPQDLADVQRLTDDDR